MAWETFPKRAKPLVARPEVSVQSGGSFNLNSAAFEALGSPQAVELLYDRDRRCIGFRSVDPSSPDAYAFQGTQAGKGKGTYIVSGKAFCAYYGIELSDPVRREAHVEDGVLFVDLNDPGRISGRGRRSVSQDTVIVLDEATTVAYNQIAGMNSLPASLGLNTLDSSAERLLKVSPDRFQGPSE